MSANLNKLKVILREMFQLDQADLDYSIEFIFTHSALDVGWDMTGTSGGKYKSPCLNQIIVI